MRAVSRFRLGQRVVVREGTDYDLDDGVPVEYDEEIRPMAGHYGKVVAFAEHSGNPQVQLLGHIHGDPDQYVMTPGDDVWCFGDEDLEAAD
jgi:hypothetical protein